MPRSPHCSTSSPLLNEQCVIGQDCQGCADVGLYYFSSQRMAVSLVLANSRSACCIPSHSSLEAGRGLPAQAFADEEDDQFQLKGKGGKDKGPTRLYGRWQTAPWVPPTAEGGQVPKNERGNVLCPPLAFSLPTARILSSPTHGRSATPGALLLAGRSLTGTCFILWRSLQRDAPAGKCTGDASKPVAMAMMHA